MKRTENKKYKKKITKITKNIDKKKLELFNPFSVVSCVVYTLYLVHLDISPQASSYLAF